MLILHPEARLEYQAIVEWYEATNPQLAAEIDQRLLDALDAIAANPRAWPLVPGRRTERLGVRRFVLDRFPFTLPFDIQEELVTVLAVAHMRRRPGYWLARVPPR